MKDIISSTFSHLKIWKLEKNGWKHQTTLPFHIFQRSFRWPTLACSFELGMIEGIYQSDTFGWKIIEQISDIFCNPCPCDWWCWMMLDASVMPNPLQCTVPWPSAIYTLFWSEFCYKRNPCTAGLCLESPTESELPKNQSLPTIESFLKELIMIP